MIFFFALPSLPHKVFFSRFLLKKWSLPSVGVKIWQMWKHSVSCGTAGSVWAVVVHSVLWISSYSFVVSLEQFSKRFEFPIPRDRPNQAMQAASVAYVQMLTSLTSDETLPLSGQCSWSQTALCRLHPMKSKWGSSDSLSPPAPFRLQSNKAKMSREKCIIQILKSTLGE